MYLYKSSCVVAVQISNHEAFLRLKFELADAGLQKLVGCHFLVLLGGALRHLCGIDGQAHLGSQGVVDVHEGETAAEGAPQQGDGVGIVVGFVLLLGDPALEPGDGAQAQLQLQAAVEERALLVGALVQDIVGSLDRPAVDGGAGEGGRRGEEGRGAGGGGALGVAVGAVRVARVLALVALVGHGGGPVARGDAGVGGMVGGRVGRLGRVCAGKTRVKSHLHASAHPFVVAAAASRGEGRRAGGRGRRCTLAGVVLARELGGGALAQGPWWRGRSDRRRRQARAGAVLAVGRCSTR